MYLDQGLGYWFKKKSQWGMGLVVNMVSSGYRKNIIQDLKTF
jgi:hypothetical protein